MNTRPLDELAARIGQVFEKSPAKDIEKQMKQVLTNGLAKLDVVPRSEFDVQAQVLLRTREKLEAMERRLAELESRVAIPMGGPGAASPSTGSGSPGQGGAGCQDGPGPAFDPSVPPGPEGPGPAIDQDGQPHSDAPASGHGSSGPAR